MLKDPLEQKVLTARKVIGVYRTTLYRIPIYTCQPLILLVGVSENSAYLSTIWALSYERQAWLK